MAHDFFEHDWDRRFLLPEDMRDRVPEGDLALCVIDVVKGPDISEFYSRYRSDGWGAAA